MRAHPLRRTAVGLLAAATLLSGALVPTAASALSRAHSAAGCNPVLFLGARGSGEYGPGSAHWPKGRKADDKYGFGPEVNEVYGKIAAGLSASPEAYSVDYGADRVTTLFHDYPKYFKDLQAGVTWVMDKLTSLASACPHQLIVLAGYSQGAMVMHRIVRALATTTRADAAIAARIAAVVLVGDGDQVPHDNVTRFGTAGSGAHGIGLALRTISHSSAAKLPPGIGSRVLEVCTKHDIVCGWTNLDLVCLDIGIPTLICAHGVYVHLHYPGSMPLADAAAQAVTDLRARLAGGGAWGKAIEVPGIAALDTGGSAAVISVSCASSGNCAAGGQYTNSKGRDAAFVVSEVNGIWGTAQKVPGTAEHGAILSISCASAGNCTAGGANQYAFVVSEVNGTWGKAIVVPGAAAAGIVQSSVSSVSCASAGNCSAGGFYSNGGASEAFLVSQTGGSWGRLREVPGTAALNTGGDAAVNTVSCGSAGNCSAGGGYQDAGGNQAFVVSQTGGTWGKAIEVPGTAALNTSGNAVVESVSCRSAGNCSAGGLYSTGTAQDVFVVSQVNGTWHSAIKVHGILAGADWLTSVSCGSPGNCSAGGYYADGDVTAPFVVNETDGTWGTATNVPGTSGTGDKVVTISCGSAGNCSAGGDSVSDQTFVVNETDGTWGTATGVRGLGTGGSLLWSVSCPPAGNCAAGGAYANSSGKTQQAFVVSESGG